MSVDYTSGIAYGYLIPGDKVVELIERIGEDCFYGEFEDYFIRLDCYNAPRDTDWIFAFDNFSGPDAGCATLVNEMNFYNIKRYEGIGVMEKLFPNYLEEFGLPQMYVYLKVW